MKIKIGKQRITHYQANCHGCGWVENEHHDREWLRQEVAKHIRKTGHSVSIEKGTSTLYEAAEHPLHTDAAAGSAKSGEIQTETFTVKPGGSTAAPVS